MLVFFDLLLRLSKTFGVLTKLRANAQDFSVIWGNNGNCGQHSFHQWLREGTWCTSINLVKVEDAGHAHDKMARVLNANADAQAEALVTREKEEFYNSLMVIILNKLCPELLGALMSLYEHKTSLFGWLLKINPFDQPGVEFAKKLAKMLEE